MNDYIISSICSTLIFYGDFSILGFNLGGQEREGKNICSAICFKMAGTASLVRQVFIVSFIFWEGLCVRLCVCMLQWLTGDILAILMETLI